VRNIVRIVWSSKGEKQTVLLAGRGAAVVKKIEHSTFSYTGTSERVDEKGNMRTCRNSKFRSTHLVRVQLIHDEPGSLSPFCLASC
jgi:hypothetical protein